MAKIRRDSVLSACAALALTSATMAQAPAMRCPTLEQIGGLPGAKFQNGSFGVRGPLNVNPDGTKASYTEGDHGFTYIANSMSLWHPWRSCEPTRNNCRGKFLDAEKKNFGPGTQEFCVFAIEVDPPKAGASAESCGAGKLVIGNGKGRPRLGSDTLATIDGGQTRYYVSMTHLRQLVDAKTEYVDSAAVPSIVVPGEDAKLLGSVVFVSYQGHKTLAVVGDTGPKFGEGSIALHQILRYGAIETPPLVGPIPLQKRCSASELSLRAPFESRPDVAGDVCRDGYTPRQGTDVRAYKAIGDGVTMVVLGNASLPMKGTVAQVPVTVGSLREAATKAGYTDESMTAMAACLAVR